MRKTPLKRKNKTPKAKMRDLADRLARAYCMELGGCVACDYTFGTRCTGCYGRLEWCHLKSRHHATIRHDPLNFVPMCCHHHRYFTNSPDEWTRLIENLYPGRWERLNAILLEGGKPDYKFWVDYYTRRIAS